MMSRSDEGPQAMRRLQGDIGWVVLSGRRRVIGANPAAQAIMEDGLGRLEVSAGRTSPIPPTTEALARALDQARSQPNGQVILKLERDGEEGRGSPGHPPTPCPAWRTTPMLIAGEDDHSLALASSCAVAETGRLWNSIIESFGLTRPRSAWPEAARRALPGGGRRPLGERQHRAQPAPRGLRQDGAEAAERPGAGPDRTVLGPDQA